MAIQPNDNFVTLQVNFRRVFALIDTGAVASCMSAKFAKYLKLRPETSAGSRQTEVSVSH